MATDKKSVLLYCDIITTVEKLSNENAGLLLKHYLRYINDLNPEPPNDIIDLVFEPIKQNLKRDLKSWEAKCLKNSDNAKIRWDKENANASKRIKPDANHADKDKVIDTVKDKVKYNFRQSLVLYGFLENLITDWLVIRKNKKASNTETAFNGFIKEVEKSGMDKNEVLRICVERSWAGLNSEWLKKDKVQSVITNQPQGPKLIPF